VNDLVPDRLDKQWTRSAMAKRAGVAPTTLANWSERPHDPLQTIEASNGDALYTWRLLLNFCRGNPQLTATSQVLDRAEELFADASRDILESQRPPVGAATRTQSLPFSADARSSDGATLRSALQDLKTQVGEHSAVVAAATQLAADAAVIQAALVERLVQLEVAVDAAVGAGD